MTHKEEVVKNLVALLGEENVVSSDEAIFASDAVLLRGFEKAFGYKPEHLALAVAMPGSTEDVSKVLRYCNDNGIHVIARTGMSSSEDQLLVTDDNTIFLDGCRLNKIIKELITEKFGNRHLGG